MKRRALLSALGLTGCGYHVGGKADLLPKTVRTIAIPTFGNLTTRYKISDRLGSAISREFLTRTRYQIVADPNDADATLRGSVLTYTAFPTVVDQVTGRAAGVQVSVVLQVTLTDRASGKVLFTRANMEVRERYEISIDQAQYFEESETALDRLSRDVARTIVSAVLSGF
ncbi:MAG: LptE family protein [Acidobacteriaceae bacterium]|jgi:outer membrane lipopolysaccharide assembly protein LptE/RlpB|nr:LptE family protein [Acidobacteriaceae bacterium]